MRKLLKIFIFSILIANAIFQVAPKAQLNGFLSAKLNKITPVSIVKADENINKQVYNAANKNTKFGFDEKYKQTISLQSIKDESYINTLKKSGSWDSIQLNSAYDYLNLTSKIDFASLSKTMNKQLSYELYSFPYDKSLQKKPSIMQLNGAQTAYKTTMKSSQYEYLFGEGYLKNPSYLKVKEQYLYLDSKYNFNKLKNQVPICIYSYNPGLVAKGRHEQFFKRLSKQNYTNYHIVYVVDNQADTQIKGILNYLANSKYPFKNNIQIVRNLQQLGPLGSAYFWINKLCDKKQIVAMVDAADFLIGQQSLNVINWAYQSSNTWFAYTRMFVSRNVLQCDTPGSSKGLTVPLQKYRTSINIIDVSHLKTFRKQLFQKLTLDMLLEYKIDFNTNSAFPSFYSTGSDSFIVFSLLEMCGEARIKYISDFLYLNSGTTSTAACFFLQSSYDENRARIKTPFKTLNTINDTPSHVEDYKPNKQLFQALEKTYQSYRKCARLPKP